MRQISMRQFGLALASAVAIAGPAAANCTFDVPFGVASASLSADQSAFLTEFAAQNPSITVSVTGYASPEGASSANLALSRARADTVADFLVTKSGKIVISKRGAGESAEAGRIARVSTDNCRLPAGAVVAGGSPAAAAAATAIGAVTPAVAVGGVVGALALGAALSGGGDSNSSGSTPSAGSTPTSGSANQ